MWTGSGMIIVFIKVLEKVEFMDAGKGDNRTCVANYGFHKRTLMQLCFYFLIIPFDRGNTHLFACQQKFNPADTDKLGGLAGT